MQDIYKNIRNILPYSVWPILAANKKEREIKMILKMPREQRMQIVSLVQQYFREERDEEIGNLAAELLMDFMIKQLSPWIYNQAINDAQSIVSQKMASLEEDVYALKIPIKLSYQND
jgi:uncharacterized protein (DUF2164 family)